MEIYHNPRCSKSRQTLELLKKEGFDPKIRLYLENPPSSKELKSILKMLNMSAKQLLRKNEQVFKDLKAKHGDPSDEQVFEWMLKHPVLIERPIVIHNKKARLGRPPELVKEIL